MRVARVERSAVVIVLFLVSVTALKKGGVAVSRVAVRRRINDKSARFGTPGPPNVEDMETRCGRKRSSITVLVKSLINLGIKKPAMKLLESCMNKKLIVRMRI